MILEGITIILFFVDSDDKQKYQMYHMLNTSSMSFYLNL